MMRISKKNNAYNSSKTSTNPVSSSLIIPYLRLVSDVFLAICQGVRIVLKANGSEEIIEAKASAPLSGALQAFLEANPGAKSSVYTSNIVSFQDDEMESNLSAAE
ncbi:hypothetical protein EON65_56755, partial [archaeon]